VKQSARHIEFLDYVRGTAILAVFLFHSLSAAYGFVTLRWHNWLPSFSVSKSFLVLLPVSLGWTGVAVFFVVSGFCIHLSFQRDGRQWGRFFVRRFFRIYPPYLLAVLFFALIFPATRLAFTYRPHADWLQLISHSLLIHNFVPGYTNGISASFWSIAVEAQLYCIYPVLLLLVGRLGWRRTLICLLVCEVLMRGLTGLYYEITYKDIPDWFAVSPLVFGSVGRWALLWLKLICAPSRFFWPNHHSGYGCCWRSKVFS
jgi:peptidoglycan/LPS O-acetylase OafA/YrhL